MMQNFEVLPPPKLDIERLAGSVKISWPDSAQGYSLQSAPVAEAHADWQPVPQTPIRAGGRWTVSILEPGGHRFYRLMQQ